MKPKLDRRWSRRQFIAGASAAVGTVAAAALVTWLGSQTQHSPGTPASTPSPPTQTPKLKAALHGLLSLDPTPSPAAYRAHLAGYVVSQRGREGALDWTQVQAKAFGPLTHPNPIDAALKEVRAWNAAHPGQPPQRLKLRCHGGIRALPDVMDAGGPHFLSRDLGFNTPIQPCPRFWAPQYASAWYDFQAKLAAAYDQVPEVAEIVAARCMMQYAEPFLRFIGDSWQVQQLNAAGFDSDRDRQQSKSAERDYALHGLTLFENGKSKLLLYPDDNTSGANEKLLRPSAE